MPIGQPYDRPLPNFIPDPGQLSINNPRTSTRVPNFRLGHRVRSALDFLGIPKERLLNILGLFGGKPRFQDLFSSFPTKGPQGRIFVGAGGLQRLLDSGLIGEGKAGGARLGLIQSILDHLNGVGGGDGGGGGGPGVEPGPGGTAHPSTPGGPHFPGFPDLPELDQELVDEIIDHILGTLREPGLPEELILDTENRIRGDSKLQFRDAARRSSDSFAARGLFGSGLQRQDVRNLEQAFGRSRLAALNQLSAQNAQFGLEAVRNAIGMFNSLSNAQGQFAGIANDRIGLAISEALGLRGLDLQEMQLLMDQTLRELLLTIQLGGLAGFGNQANPFSNVTNNGSGIGGGGFPRPRFDGPPAF